MTLLQGVCDKKSASRHHSERNKERHPVIRLPPEDHATDKETDQCRHDSKHERECGIAPDRETKLLHCLCGVSGGLHKSARWTGTHRLELCKVRWKENDEDSQRKNNQAHPCNSSNEEPAPMQPCIIFVMPFMAQGDLGRCRVQVHSCPPCAPLEATSEAPECKEAGNDGE